MPKPSREPRPTGCGTRLGVMPWPAASRRTSSKPSWGMRAWRRRRAIQGRQARPAKVAAYEDYLRQRVAAASPDWIPATVLWREIAQMGFNGCERSVRNFVATLRPTAPPDPMVRFETEPGVQLQVDWIEFRRKKDAGLFAFVATLGHSRSSYVEFVSDMKLEIFAVVP